jgi:hypothetical protein
VTTCCDDKAKTAGCDAQTATAGTASKATAPAKAAARTWTFSLTIGGTSHREPLEIKGTVTAADHDVPAGAGH